MATLTKRTTITHEVDVPGTDLTFEAQGPMPDLCDEVWVRPLTDSRDGSAYAVSWLVSDEYRDDLVEWDDLGTDPTQWVNGCFRDFRNTHDGGGEEARNAYIEEAIEVVGKDRVFIVDVYSHGLDHFSVANTQWYPDRQWDVAPACVLVVPTDVTNPREWADGMMEQWTAVVNGDCWIIVTHYIDAEGGVVDCEVIGGFVGYEYASKCAESGDY